MTEQKLVTVGNSWQATLSMDEAISIFTGSEDDQYLQKKDEISLNENTELCLTNPTDDPSECCFLEFVCAAGTGLHEICVRSDIPTMEVFDKVEGYLLTAKGHSPTDNLVTCSMKFERPRTHILVKCLRQEKNIKLQHILLRVESQPVPVGCQGLLNIPKLRSILEDLNPETSERASSILDNIETYQKNNQTPIVDMSCLLMAAQRSMSAGGNIADMLSTVENKNTCGNNNEMYSALQGICGQVTNLRPGPGGTNLNALVSTESVDNLVEERISKAEARILETVDERLQHMENRLASKLDALLSTLSTTEVSKSE